MEAVERPEAVRFHIESGGWAPHLEERAVVLGGGSLGWLRRAARRRSAEAEAQALAVANRSLPVASSPAAPSLPARGRSRPAKGPQPVWSRQARSATPDCFHRR